MSIHCDFCEAVCGITIHKDGNPLDKVFVSAPGDRIHICDECVAVASKCIETEKAKHNLSKDGATS